MPSENVKHRLRWSHQEIKIVTDASIELLLHKYKADMFPSADAVQKDDINTALSEGQLVLAAERRKKKIDGYIAGKLAIVVRDGLRSKISAMKSNGGKPELAVVVPAIVEPVNDETMQVKEPPQMIDMVAGLGEALGGSIARGFVKEIEHSPMMADLIKLLTARMPPKPAVVEPRLPGPRIATSTVSFPERLRRPKVAIIGLHADQRQVIMRQFPNLDMRFLDNRPTGDRLETVTASCDAAVLMTKFCSHLPMKKCKAKHYVPVNGGMTDLAHVLRGRYGEPTSARNAA